MGFTDSLLYEIYGQIRRSRKLCLVFLKMLSRRVGFVFIDEAISIIIYSVNCKQPYKGRESHSMVSGSETAFHFIIEWLKLDCFSTSVLNGFL
jgi:hypothetical protein